MIAGGVPVYFLKDDGSREKRMFNVFMALKQGYETGDFEYVEPYLTDESVFKSQWVREELTGEKDIMHYLRGKGETLKKYNALGVGDFIVYSGGVFLRLTPNKDDPENEPIAIVVDVDDDGMAAWIALCDIDLLLDTSEDGDS